MRRITRDKLRNLLRRSFCESVGDEEFPTALLAPSSFASRSFVIFSATLSGLSESKSSPQASLRSRKFDLTMSALICLRARLHVLTVLPFSVTEASHRSARDWRMALR
eukprot:5632487-Pyramimonas_sp.AAC.1